MATGAFLSRDPAGFVDGPNLYAYVRQNPWSAFDPEGLFLDIIANAAESFGGWVAEKTGLDNAIMNSISEDTASGISNFDAKHDVGGKINAVRNTAVATGEMLSPVSSDALRAAGRMDARGLAGELARSKLKVVDKAMTLVETGQAALDGDLTALAMAAGSHAKIPGKKGGHGPEAPGGPSSKDIAENPAANSGQIWEVGEHDTLRKIAETGLDSHHVGQDKAMRQFVPEYDRGTAPAILVPKQGHTVRIDPDTPVVSRRTSGFNSARDVVARDIKEMRRVYPNAPNSQLQKLVDMNKQKYPDAMKKK